MLLQPILLEELILYTLCAPIADTVSAVGAVSPTADAVSAIEETASTADTLSAFTNDTVSVSVHNHSPKGRAQRQRKRESDRARRSLRHAEVLGKGDRTGSSVVTVHLHTCGEPFRGTPLMLRVLIFLKHCGRVGIN